MHDSIGGDLSAVVMPADLPRTSVGHSNELAWKVHDLGGSIILLTHSLCRHTPRSEGSFLMFEKSLPGLLLVFGSPSSRPTIHRELKVKRPPLSDPKHLDPWQRLALQPFEERPAGG